MYPETSNKTSTITFGGIPEDILDYVTENAVSHRIAGSFHWILKLNEFKYGNQTIESTTNRAFMDTGASHIFLPGKDYDALAKTVCKGHFCFSMEQGEFIPRCSDETYNSFESLWFTIDSHMYEVPVSSYIRQINLGDLDSPYCWVQLIKRPQMNHILLGVSFLENYIQVYDLIHNQMALVSNRESEAKIIAIDNSPYIGKSLLL